MKNLIITLVTALCSCQLLFAQLTGTKTIPGDYATIAAAISALNTSGVGTGGVTFNVAAGTAETWPTPTQGIITALNTSSVANPVIFQKAGAGSNPKITVNQGTGTMDGIIIFNGCDYVTFDGIDLAETAGNATNNTRLEWGYAILKTTGTNGAQNITIKNCSVALNKANGNSVGIYSNNHTTSSLTDLVVSSSAGTNSNLKIFNNSITNVSAGIKLFGYNDPSDPFAFYDQNNEIGKDGANSISNFRANGISTTYQNMLTVANNSVTGTVDQGIYCYAISLEFAYKASLELYNNTVSITYLGNGYWFKGIYVTMGEMGPTPATNTMNIYNNSIIGNITGLTEINGQQTADYLEVTFCANTTNIYGNTVSNNTHGSITTGGGDISGVNIRSLQLQNPTTSVMNVHDNVINNNSSLSGNTALTTNYLLRADLYNGTGNIYNNTVDGFSSSKNLNTYVFYTAEAEGFDVSVHHNTFKNVSSSGGTLIGMYCGSNINSYYRYYNNTISNLSLNGTVASVFGMYGFSYGNPPIIYNNMISDLRTPQLNAQSNTQSGIFGIGLYGLSGKCYNNSIYLNGSSSGSGLSSSGIKVAINLTVLELRNNVIVINSVPGSTGKNVALEFLSYDMARYSSLSDNNLFYSGIPSAKNLIFFDHFNSLQTLEEFKAVVSPRDANSVTELPPFINASSSPYNLHLQPGASTLIESRGAQVNSPVSISNDYDGDLRQGQSGYSGTGTAPDIGADEFNGTYKNYAPTLQATNIVFSAVGNTQMTLNWTNGNGSSRAVFVKAGTTGTAAPVTATTYTANTIFGNGTQIAASGWYCVYNGTGSTVNLTGLVSGNDYQVHVCEYIGTPGTEEYLTTSATNNPKNQPTISNNADLVNLIISNGTLNPVFGSSTISYTANVASNITNVTVTPTATKSNSTIKVNGIAVISGTASQSIALLSGSNTITTVVTASDGITQKTYTIIVTRAIGMPSVQATNIAYSNIGLNSFQLNWTRGNGSKCAVFVKQTYWNTAMPANNTTYTASTVYGSGSQIGTTGWYCIYNGAGTTVSVTGLTQGTTYIVHVCEYNGAAGYEQYNTNVVTFNPRDQSTLSPPISWTGSTSTDWAVPGNWSSGVVPVWGDNVTIPSAPANQPHVTLAYPSMALCTNLTIDAGAVVTVDGGKILAITGTLINNAGVNGLIVNSGAMLYELSGAPATVKRDMGANEWHLISVPTSNATSAIFTGRYLQVFSEPDNLYSDITPTTVPLISAQGYALWGEGFTTEYKGPVNAGPKSIAITNAVSGWNLVGNPYPTTIDWDAGMGWTKTNVNNAIYMHVNSSTWATYISGAQANGGSRYIAPGQGFFVKASGNGTLAMNDNVKSISPATFFKNSNTDKVDHLVRLQVAGNGFTDEAVVRLAAEATAGFDSDWDAQKLFGDEPDAPQIYTQGETELIINALQEVQAVPVGLRAAKSGNYSISATEINDFTEVTLEDTKTGMFTNLLKDSYSFNFTQSEAEQRFILHFGTLSVAETNTFNAEIYSYQQTVYVNMHDQIPGDVYVYNIAGQLMASRLSSSGLSEFKMQTCGNYIVKVVGKENILVRKVWIQ